MRARLLDPLLFYRDPLELHAAKYRQSCRTARKVARRYRRSSVAGVYARESAHLTLSRLGLASALIRRRNRDCSDSELRSAAQALNQIAQITIPTVSEVSALCNQK